MDGWTVKLVACAALTLSGAAGGRALGAARRMRVTQLAALRQGLSALSVNMLERLLPLAQALCSSGCEGLCLIGAGLETDDPAGAYAAACQRLTARDGPFSCLEEEELQVLGQLFDQLGATGASRQRMAIQETLEQLKRIEGHARLRAEEQARLYGTLGLLSGLALAVCLL